MNMNYRSVLLSLVILISMAPLSWAAETEDYKALGMALYRAGEYSKAADYFQKAVQADPKDWRAYVDLGNAYNKQGDSQNAREAYETSLRINPDNITVRNILKTLPPGSSDETAKPAVNTNSDGMESPANKTTEEIKSTPPQAKPAPANAAGFPHSMTYSDNLETMNHSKFFGKVEFGYSYSKQDDFINAAAAYTGLITAGGYGGTATASNHGFNFGGEIGLLLNPYNGIAVGARVIRGSDYHLDVNFEPGVSFPDYEKETLEPFVVPITLDYYLFLPDSTGRFFLTVGLGYYRGTVRVNDDYDFIDAGGTSDTVTGDLTSGDIGFQAGLGREWAINSSFGFSVYARGRYAKISNFKGTLTNLSGQTGEFGLKINTVTGTMDYDSTYNINAASNARYAVLDFTGFEAGLAFTFYTY